MLSKTNAAGLQHEKKWCSLTGWKRGVFFAADPVDRKSKLWPVGSHCMRQWFTKGFRYLIWRYGTLFPYFWAVGKGLGIPLHIGQIPYCLHRCLFRTSILGRAIWLLETKNIAIQNRLRFIDFPHNVSWMHLCWYVIYSSMFLSVAYL